MKKKLINLYETNLPLNFEIESIEMPIDDSIGKPLFPMRISIEIKKLSSELFLCKGKIEVSFIDTCQACLNETVLKLDINIDTSIKDELSINKSEEVIDESHYQDLKFFDLDKLIVEEVYLNYPSVTYCPGRVNDEDKNLKLEQKVQPFKKIRDLLD